MKSSRLEAFSDGVMAIIITIMVLELKVPHGAGWQELRPVLPIFLSYVLSFLYVGIYWNNHHHLFMATERVNALIMWLNLLVLFFLSLIPFVTAWMGENHFAPLPSALYGLVLLLTGGSYTLLQWAIVHEHGPDAVLAKALGTNYKGKLSPAFYALAIAFSFWQEWIAHVIYVGVALMWLIPDRGIEREVAADEEIAVHRE